MASDLPGRPQWYVGNTVARVVDYQRQWRQGVASIGLDAMAAGGWTTPGGGWPSVPRSIAGQYGVMATALWALPRINVYTELLNTRADAYGAAVGAVPTRQLTYLPPSMPAAPAGLSRREVQRYGEAWRSAYGYQLPIALDVPAVGINNPVLAGSREDPRGPRRPVWR